MEESAALAAGLKPLARIKAWASSGVTHDGHGTSSTQKALQLSGLQLSDIDLIEANEAFAAQFLAVGKTLGFDAQRLTSTAGLLRWAPYRCQRSVFW
jgi:acetyl-CoA C-acetyltransferase